MTTNSIIVRVAWVAGVAFYAGIGLWAFFSPRSFYEAVAIFPPFNAHFLRDAGAFQLGIGAGLIAAARFRDGLLVVLVGAGAASVLHAVGHFVDADLGGKPSDPWLLSLFAVVMVVGAVQRSKEVRR